MAFLTQTLGNFGQGLAVILRNETFVVGLMFIAFLLGTFAMFKGLLRFSFKKSGQFQGKEINVIALMLSIISSSGVFFIFGQSPQSMILLFGGFAGLIVVVFLMIFLMHTMYTFAEHFKDEDGAMGKGVGWIFIMSLGVILSSYLLLGYTSKVLSGLRGKGLFGHLNSFAGVIVELALLGALIFGLVWLLKGSGDDDKSNTHSDDDEGGGLFGTSRNERRNREDAGEIRGIMEEMNRGIQTADDTFRRIQDNIHKLSQIVQAQAGDTSSEQDTTAAERTASGSGEGGGDGSV